MSQYRKKKIINRDFQKKLHEIEQEDALDVSIDFKVDLMREKILLHIFEKSSVINKEHLFEVKKDVYIGKKAEISLLDSTVDERHLAICYKDNGFYVRCLSKKGIRVERKGRLKMKSYILTAGSVMSLKTNDTILVGGTSLLVEMYSSRRGILF